MTAQPTSGGVARANPSGGGTLADVLDRVLDKGVVIEAWAAVSLLGIEVVSVQAQVVVASVESYLKFAEAISSVSLPSAEKPEILEQPPQAKQMESPAAQALPEKSQAGEAAPRSGGARAPQQQAEKH
jgi:hypothetical protein